MVEKHLRKCSKSLVLRETQTKTMLRFYFTAIRMSLMKHSGDSTCCEECGERGTVLHCRWAYKLVQTLCKSTGGFFRKLAIDLLEYPAISLFYIYPKDAPPNHMANCPTMFIAALFLIARDWKQLISLTTEQIQKMWFIYTMKYFSATKK